MDRVEKLTGIRIRIVGEIYAESYIFLGLNID